MLSQSEADRLIAMTKKRTDNQIYTFPSPNKILTITIVSIDEKESFLIDINRKGTIRLTRCSYQERYQKTIILVRLDIDGPPHTNPEVKNIPLPYLAPYNGKTIKCPHLHLYVEGYMDKWAIPASPEKFPQTNDVYLTLYDFFRYCKIIEPPNIQRGLFI